MILVIEAIVYFGLFPHYTFFSDLKCLSLLSLEKDKPSTKSESCASLPGLKVNEIFIGHLDPSSEWARFVLHPKLFSPLKDDIPAVRREKPIAKIAYSIVNSNVRGYESCFECNKTVMRPLNCESEHQGRCEDILVTTVKPNMFSNFTIRYQVSFESQTLALHNPSQNTTN